MAKSNVALARRGWEAARRGDLDVIGDMLDPEVKWHGGDPDAEGACRNRPEALEFMRRTVQLGGVGELLDVIGVGDRVVVIVRPPDSRAGAVANLTTFRDGKVIEMVHYPNPQDALAAARSGEARGG